MAVIFCENQKLLLCFVNKKNSVNTLLLLLLLLLKSPMARVSGEASPIVIGIKLSNNWAIFFCLGVVKLKKFIITKPLLYEMLKGVT